MSGWNGFLVAQVGASAALAGLVFVGVSINLTRILSTGSLPEYALQALVLLLAVLVISSLLLAPQPLTASAIELLLAGVADTAMLLFLVIYSRRKIDPRSGRGVKTG
jgi:modulator of FtsH protease